MGGRGQMLVLAMGGPVKVVDLAAHRARLSGRGPRMRGAVGGGPRDGRVGFAGWRRGEQIHEERGGGDEPVGETEHPKIKRLSRPPVDSAWLTDQLLELEQLAEDGDTLEVVGKLGAIVRRPVRESLPP